MDSYSKEIAERYRTMGDIDLIELLDSGKLTTESSHIAESELLSRGINKDKAREITSVNVATESKDEEAAQNREPNRRWVLWTFIGIVILAFRAIYSLVRQRPTR